MSRTKDQAIDVRALLDRERCEIVARPIRKQGTVILKRSPVNVEIVIWSVDLLPNRRVIPKSMEGRRRQKEQKIAGRRVDHHAEHIRRDIVDTELVDQQQLRGVSVT